VIKGDSLSYNLGMKFTTKDRDNDKYWGYCAKMRRGGWWYNACGKSNLNGLYLYGGHTPGKMYGITWASWKGSRYTMKSVVMKIRPYPEIVPISDSRVTTQWHGTGTCSPVRKQKPIRL